MNILILNWRDIKNPNAGGAEIVTQEHAKSWVQSGNQVTFFSSHFGGAKKEEIIDGITIIRRGNAIFGVQIHAFFWYLFSRSDRYDLVIDQFHGIPFFTPLYIRSKKIAFIHEVAKEIWKLNPWPKPFNLIPSIFGVFFEEWIFRIFYKSIPFLTVSNSTKKDLIDWGIPKNNITVVLNGVSKPHTSKRKKQTTKTILYLGALASDKGIFDAIAVFSELFQMDPNYQFWIAGKGDDKITNSLKEMVEKKGMQRCTKFWGYVDENKKADLLSSAHILIHPSVREGWGLTVIEAASFGTPSVAFNVPGLRDSIKNGVTGALVDGRSNKEMALRVTDLVKNNAVYKRYQAECLKWAGRLTWEKSTTESLSYLKRVVNEK